MQIKKEINYTPIFWELQNIINKQIKIKDMLLLSLNKYINLSKNIILFIYKQIKLIYILNILLKKNNYSLIKDKHLFERNYLIKLKKIVKSINWFYKNINYKNNLIFNILLVTNFLLKKNKLKKKFFLNL